MIVMPIYLKIDRIREMFRLFKETDYKVIFK